ncbi:hypothetical protein A6R68_14929, partial [Neotoma lepida]
MTIEVEHLTYKAVGVQPVTDTFHGASSLPTCNIYFLSWLKENLMPQKRDKEKEEEEEEDDDDDDDDTANQKPKYSLFLRYGHASLSLPAECALSK